MLYTFVISNYEFCLVKLSKFEISKIHMIRMQRYWDEKICICGKKINSFDKVVNQYHEIRTSDITCMGRDRELKWFAFSLYPLSFFLNSPFNKIICNLCHSSWGARPTNLLIKEPIDPTDQPTNQVTNQRIVQPTNITYYSLLIKEPINQLTNQQTNQFTNQPT